MYMDHVENPKEKLLNDLGDLSEVKLANNQVLVAIYVRPEKTKSGIILTEVYRDEDRYQSKAALVVKTGPVAFNDPTGRWFEDFSVTLHDWVFYRPSDGLAINFNGVPCRLLEDVSIKGLIPTPDLIW